MVTPATVKLRFLEFANIADSRIQIFIDKALLFLDQGRAGVYYNELISLLTAHYLALSQKTESGNNASVGITSSMSEGDTSIGFTSLTPTNNTQFYYQQTPYGVEFLSFKLYIGGGASIV